MIARTSFFLMLAVALSANATSRAAEPKIESVDDALGTLKIVVPEGSGAYKLSDEVIAPNITKQFRFQFDNGSAAIVISTKIRADLPKDDSVLKRAIPRYERIQATMPDGNFTFELRGNAPDRVFESVLVNAIYNEFYPLALTGESGEGVQSVGISQHFVVGGRYIECAIYLPNKDKLAKGRSDQEGPRTLLSLAAWNPEARGRQALSELRAVAVD